MMMAQTQASGLKSLEDKNRAKTVNFYTISHIALYIAVRYFSWAGVIFWSNNIHIGIANHIVMRQQL